jgi:transporter family-2 protein
MIGAYLFIALIIGLVTPVQTAINSHLRKYVQSPYAASFVSFIVGTLLLTIITLLIRHSLLISSDVFSTQPWWLWLGGIFGFLGLTANILLFPKLGGVQTVVLPMFGQIIMGMMIDSFGWFRFHQYAFTCFRGIGVIIVVLGVCMVVLNNRLGHRKCSTDRISKAYVKGKLFWQLIGIVAGMLMAMQSAINGQLGIVLHSSIHAAFISFVISTVILLFINLRGRNYQNILLALKKNRTWWIWTGGVLGSLYVMGNAFLVPIIGTGLLVVLGILGQLLCSLLIDKYGLLGANKKPITKVQMIGLLVILLGIIFIRII